MNRIYDVAQLLVSSWLLVGDKHFPTSDGLMDKALKEAARKC